MALPDIENLCSVIEVPFSKQNEIFGTGQERTGLKDYSQMQGFSRLAGTPLLFELFFSSFDLNCEIRACQSVIWRKRYS
jgi:hypothetical protein